MPLKEKARLKEFPYSQNTEEKLLPYMQIRRKLPKCSWTDGKFQQRYDNYENVKTGNARNEKQNVRNGEDIYF